MIRARLIAMFHAARLEIRTRRARHSERLALTRAGELLAASRHRLPAGACQSLLGEIQRVRRELEARSLSLAGSIEFDRADYGSVASWMRPLVIVRGICSRALLRHQMIRVERELRPLYQALGAAALALPNGASGALQVPAGLVEAVRAARADLANAVAERTRILEPFDGQPCPAWLRVVASEAQALGAAVLKQVQGQLLPRVSALAGLAAGWWVTHTYTASRPRSFLRSLGIGSGGTQLVSADTYERMRFWLPILAAAICAYLGDLLARWIRRRYQPRMEVSRARQPEAITHLSVTT
jgi:hypothetical protein